MGFGHSTMGHLGHVWNIPNSPGTLGWEGQYTLPWDTCNMSGISQIVPGLWDGKDSGIWALYHGTLGTCLSSPRTLGWEGQV